MKLQNCTCITRWFGMPPMQPLILNKAKPVMPKSWESAEYLKDWGLTSMNASTAYALGFNGSGVKLA